jgi:hypothetical protein
MTGSLEDFYRSKEVYITLPTNGKYYKKNTFVTGDKELGIMPMSSRDEMLLKIPDTLYNGEALFELIKSVAPDIEDPYEVLIPDLDAILLATRIASYGKEMEVSATCTHCETRTDYSINLTNVIAKLTTVPEIEAEVNGLIVKFKPNSIAVITAKRLADVEQQRVLIAMQQNQDNIPAYQEQFQNSITQITATNLTLLANKIESVTKPDGEVITDFDEILKWITNTTSKVTNQLNELTKDINKSGIPETFNFTCSNPECEKQFDSPFEFNPTFFFSNN